MKTEHVHLIKGINSLNTVLAELYHYLVNTVSSISSVYQLSEIDTSYVPKFVETTKLQVDKLTKMLEDFGTLRGLIDHNTRNYLSRQDKYFNIEKEVTNFLEAIEKKNETK